MLADRIQFLIMRERGPFFVAQMPVRWFRALAVSLVVFLMLLPAAAEFANAQGTPTAEDQVLDEVPESAEADVVPGPEPTLVPIEESQQPTENESNDADETGGSEQPSEMQATPDETSDYASDDVQQRPLIVYSMAGPPVCSVAPGHTTEIESGGSALYHCVDDVEIGEWDSDDAEIQLEWSGTVSVSAGWLVQIRAGTTYGVAFPEWTSEPSETVGLSSAASYLIGTGDGSENAPLHVTFDLLVLRPECNIAQPQIQLQRDVTISAGGVEIEQTADADTGAFELIPELAPVPEPVVSIDGPLSFGEVEVTAAAAAETKRMATLEISLTDFDAACGNWSISLSSSELTDDGGSALVGSQLLARSVNQTSLGNPGCDLVSGCGLLVASGGDEAVPDTVIVEIELLLPALPDPGAFHATIEVEAVQVESG